MRPPARTAAAVDALVSFLRAGRGAMLPGAVRRGESHAEEPLPPGGTPRRPRGSSGACRRECGRPSPHRGGVTSLRGIAKALNERGIPTVAGSDRWHHAQVRRLLARMPA
jgi:hypothetical protein